MQGTVETAYQAFQIFPIGRVDVWGNTRNILQKLEVDERSKLKGRNYVMFREPLLVYALDNLAHTLGQKHDAYVHLISECGIGLLMGTSRPRKFRM